MSWISEVGHSIGDAWSWFTTARVAAAAAVVALCVALFTASVGVRTLRQARRDSKARSRPMLSAELRGVPDSPSQMLVIRNYGPSIARDVRVTFEPPIEMPENPARLVTPYLLKRYAAPIRVMTPGMELDNLYFLAEIGPDRKYISKEPLPDTVTVKVAYKSDDGDPYSDEFPLDVKLLQQRTLVTPSGSPEGQAKQRAPPSTSRRSQGR